MRALSSLLLVSPLLLAASACSSPAELLVTEAVYDAGPVDAGPPDAEPEAGPSMLGPALVIDDMHIASIQESFHAFALLGNLLNDQLQMNIQNGTLSFGLELRELDDPSGYADKSITVAMIGLADSDGNASDNFDPDKPETFTAAPLSFGNNGDPQLLFSTAWITKGHLHAESVDALNAPGIPLPFAQPTIDGTLSATEDGAHVRILDEGRLTGAVPANLIAVAPNITQGQCKGQTLLDVVVTGCGFITYQPEVDLDGDGLEKFFDDEGDPDAGTAKDGRVDRCVDGDGTEILGTDCPTDSRMADGYKLVFVIHGVRATVLAP